MGTRKSTLYHGGKNGNLLITRKELDKSIRHISNSNPRFYIKHIKLCNPENLAEATAVQATSCPKV